MYKILIWYALVTANAMQASGARTAYSLVGRKAPDFSAQAVTGRSITTLNLKDYIGSYVVLFFYPQDFSFVCPTELLAFEERRADFDKRRARIIACSTDTAESHHKWFKKSPKKGGIKGVSYPLIADPQGRVCSAFQVLGPQGMALRATVIIDKKGVVQSISIDNVALGRCIDEILRKIDALCAIEQNGELCPANWKQGEATMPATADGLTQYIKKQQRKV